MLPVYVAIEIDLSRVMLLLVRTGEREMETETETETGGFGQWRYSYYFQFYNTFLSTAAKSMSNLSKHLSAQHGNTKLVAKDPACRSSEGVDEQPTPPKQAKLFSSVGAQMQITQKDINRLIACRLLNRPVFKKY